jgi:hypothetical protein
MIRQAHTYLVSAMSGATLIAIAIAAFVLLVSAQVFRDWPLAALGDGGGASVSKARPLSGDGGSSAGVTTGATAAAPKEAARHKGGAGTARGKTAGDGVGSAGGGIESIDSGGSGQPTSGGEGAAAPVSGGGGPQPTAPVQSPSAPSGLASGSSGSTSGGSGGSGGSAPAGPSGGSSSSGASTAGTTESTSAAVTETVNGTVGKVDEAALGGTLEDTGVTGVTEGVVNGVAGPESTVGHVVDETVKAVGSLLGGNR